jgi:nucleoside-diphosphate kinase
MVNYEDKTFIMVKPDGVQRGLIAPIVQRFEQKGFKLLAMKFVKPSQAHFEAHYADLKGKPFFNGLVNFMQSAPVLAMVWQGTNAAIEGRKLLGATKPSESAPGTIRGDFAMDIGRNIIHGSDSAESAKKEIELWVPEGLVEWTPASHKWVYE